MGVVRDMNCHKIATNAFGFNFEEIELEVQYIEDINQLTCNVRS